LAGDRFHLAPAELALLPVLVASCDDRSGGSMCGHQRAVFDADSLGTDWYVCLIRPAEPRQVPEEDRPPVWRELAELSRIVLLSDGNTRAGPGGAHRLAIELAVAADDESPLYAEVRLRRGVVGMWTAGLPTPVFSGRIGAGFDVQAVGSRHQLEIVLIDMHGNRSQPQSITFTAPPVACRAEDAACIALGQGLRWLVDQAALPLVRAVAPEAARAR
jgi:hypothetical protein